MTQITGHPLSVVPIQYNGLIWHIQCPNTHARPWILAWRWEHYFPSRSPSVDRLPARAVCSLVLASWESSELTWLYPNLVPDHAAGLSFNPGSATSIKWTSPCGVLTPLRTVMTLLLKHWDSHPQALPYTLCGCASRHIIPAECWPYGFWSTAHTGWDPSLPFCHLVGN